MTRSEFADLLRLYVATGLLPGPAAAALLDAYDAGLITEDDLPDAATTTAVLRALLVAAITGAGAGLLRRYARFNPPRFDILRSTLGLPAGASIPRQAVPGGVRVLVDRMGAAERRRFADDLMEGFAREAKRRTELMFTAPADAGAAHRSAGSVRRWQVAMRQATAEDIAQLARLGAGGPLTPSQQAQVARLVAERTRAIDALALRVTQARAGLEQPLTAKQIAANLRYGMGEARGLHYRLAASGLGEGWVVYFEGFDAAGGASCTPCRRAERGGAYLPSEAPLPGIVCEGKGHCKHYLRPSHEPATYRRLVSQQRRAA